MILDLLRHGETEQGGGLRGRIDDALTARGWQQMRAAVPAATPWQAVVSSPLQRCAAFAAELAAQRGLPLHLEPGLREQTFGTMEGQLFADLTALSPGAEHINEVRWGNGESVADVHARLIETFARIGIAPFKERVYADKQRERAEA